MTSEREKERKDDRKKEGEGGPGSVQLCEHIKQSRLCQGFSAPSEGSQCGGGGAQLI